MSRLFRFRNLVLWWNGPNFLLQEEEKWPPMVAMTRQEADEFQRDYHSMEAVPVHVTVSVNAARLLAATALTEHSWHLALLDRTSNWNRLLRITAYLWRFLRLIQGHTPQVAKEIGGDIALRRDVCNREGHITIHERRLTQTFWLRLAQQLAFPEVRGDPENLGNSHEMAFYRPRLDERGIIVVDTRLKLSQRLKDETKYPILLPKRSPIVERFILHIHVSCGHLGAKSLIYRLRFNFCLQSTRDEIRRILRMCRNTACNPPKLLKQILPPLPSERVDTKIPNSVIMIDVFGPIYYAHSCKDTDCQTKHPKKERVYGLMLTCLYTRFFNVEIMPNQTTESFWQAFLKHCHTWGCPHKCLSDNAQTFQAASKYLHRVYSQINWRQIQERAANHGGGPGIEWEFGIAKAAWSQAPCERAIGLYKRTLEKLLKGKMVSFDVLQCIVKETLAVCNDRPLAISDPALFEETPISPAHLVLGRPIGQIPQGSSHGSDYEDIPKIAWMQRQRRICMDEFRKIWFRDYLMELAAPTYAGRGLPLKDVLQEGQVVLVREEASLKKGRWILARVTKVVIGRDGNPRRIHLISGGRNFCRHIGHIALLEGSPYLRDQQEFAAPTDRPHEADADNEGSRNQGRKKNGTAEKTPTRKTDEVDDGNKDDAVGKPDSLQSPRRSQRVKKRVRFADFVAS